MTFRVASPPNVFMLQPRSSDFSTVKEAAKIGSKDSSVWEPRCLYVVDNDTDKVVGVYINGRAFVPANEDWVMEVIDDGEIDENLTKYGDISFVQKQAEVEFKNMHKHHYMSDVPINWNYIDLEYWELRDSSEDASYVRIRRGNG